MLCNVSYNDPDLDREIDKAVGFAFGWMQRLRLGGIGSPRMHVRAASAKISVLMHQDTNANTCNIELRPGGIVLRFRSRHETYALVVPYFKLSLFKGRPDEYTIHRDQHFVRVKADARVHAFMARVLDYQAQAVSTA